MALAERRSQAQFIDGTARQPERQQQLAESLGQLRHLVDDASTVVGVALAALRSVAPAASFARGFLLRTACAARHVSRPLLAALVLWFEVAEVIRCVALHTVACTHHEPDHGPNVETHAQTDGPCSRNPRQHSIYNACSWMIQIVDIGSRLVSNALTTK